jgi:hypothetical protein
LHHEIENYSDEAGSAMSEEHKREEEQGNAGLTTTALVNAGEAAALTKELEVRPPETELPPEVVATDERATPLFSPGEAKEFRVRWDTIQGGFVDEPRRAVEQADSLVAGAMKRLAEVFSDERAKLEGQWDRKEGVSTEDLRLALRRYRSFFGRLLSI